MRALVELLLAEYEDYTITGMQIYHVQSARPIAHITLINIAGEHQDYMIAFEYMDGKPFIADVC